MYANIGESIVRFLSTILICEKINACLYNVIYWWKSTLELHVEEILMGVTAILLYDIYQYFLSFCR